MKVLLLQLVILYLAAHHIVKTVVSRADGLKQAKKILGDIEEKILEAYIESYEHCGNILQGKIKGNVIPAGNDSRRFL